MYISLAGLVYYLNWFCGNAAVTAAAQKHANANEIVFISFTNTTTVEEVCFVFFDLPCACVLGRVFAAQ